MRDMNHAVDVVERDICYRGFLNLVRYRLRYGLFRGGWSPLLERECLEGLRAAAALLYDPLSDRIVFVEQFRVGLLAHGRPAWTLEPVGGMVPPGADPAAVVREEAMEEAGCSISVLETIGSCFVSPGFSDDRLTLYCGCVRADMATGVHGRAEEGEETRVVTIDAEQAGAELFTGRIDTTPAIIGVQWLNLHRERIRADWRRALDCNQRG
jgi:ADP-ribose pyrophosphatase